MTNPEPSVILNQLGPEALEFKLYVYVYDLTKGGGVQTDLRLSILEAFHAAGITMPNGSKDLNLRATDGLKRIVQADGAAMLRHRRRKRGYGRLTANGNGHSRPTDAN
jgi:small-conductance mechanosensitive channel